MAADGSLQRVEAKFPGDCVGLVRRYSPFDEFSRYQVGVEIGTPSGGHEFTRDGTLSSTIGTGGD